MDVLNLVLNLAGLVLWVGWTSSRFEPMHGPAGRLVQPAKSARPQRFWFLVGLVLLLAGRGWAYHALGAGVNWIAQLNLGAVRLPFNSAVLARAMVFSFASFGIFLAVFYLWLLLLRAVNRGSTDTNPWLRLVTLQLGWLAKLPALLGCFLPWPVFALVWYLCDPLLLGAGLMASPKSPAHLWQQAAVVGLGPYLFWKALIVGVLLLHVLNTYLYVGGRPFFTFASLTARNLLRPLGFLPLRTGKVDFLPLAGIALTLLLFNWAERGLVALLPRLPL